MISPRKTLTAATAALVVATGALASVNSAEAGPRYGRYHYHRGPAAGPVVAGVIGGLALGAFAAAASRSAYAGPRYAPVYGDGYAAADYAAPYQPQCFIQRQPVYDNWGNYAGARKVRVCQ